jgi:hypothetical protein
MTGSQENIIRDSVQAEGIELVYIPIRPTIPISVAIVSLILQSSCCSRKTFFCFIFSW